MYVRRIAVLMLAGLFVLAACGSSSKSSGSNKGPTTTKGTNFQVTTPDGQVSLSLNGQLPPDWPSNFPVPPGASPAGSGSFVNGGSGMLVGVYTTSQSAPDVFNFYKSSTAVTVGKSSSAGVSDKFVGNVSLTGNFDGNVTIVSTGGKTTFVVTLRPASSSSSTTPTT